MIHLCLSSEVKLDKTIVTKDQSATPDGRRGMEALARDSSILTRYKANGLFSTSNPRLRIASTPERQPWLQLRKYLGTHGDQEGETTRISDNQHKLRRHILHSSSIKLTAID